MPPGGRGATAGAETRSARNPRAAAACGRPGPGGAVRCRHASLAAAPQLITPCPALRHARRPGEPPPGARLPAPAPRLRGPLPPASPSSVRGAARARRRPPPRRALPAPPSLLPRSSRGPPRPLFGFTAPSFCLAPYWFFSLAQSKGRAPRAPASCYSRPRRQGPRRDAAVGLPRELSETRPS